MRRNLQQFNLQIFSSLPWDSLHSCCAIRQHKQRFLFQILIPKPHESLATLEIRHILKMQRSSSILPPWAHQDTLCKQKQIWFNNRTKETTFPNTISPPQTQLKVNDQLNKSKFKKLTCLFEVEQLYHSGNVSNPPS